MFEAEEWGADDADLQILSDASKDALGFWAPKFASGFIGDSSSFNVFLNEAIAIIAALHWSSSLHPTLLASRFTDSSNSFNTFNSLRASELYNPILMSAATIRIDHGIDLRVSSLKGNRMLSRMPSHVDLLKLFEN